MHPSRLTKNFDLTEMQCPCGHCNGGSMDPQFMAALQKLRDVCDFPFQINSGFRCFDHNKDVHGQPGSMHLSGRAADINAPLFWQRERIMQHAAECGLKGVGIGATFMHVDDRPHGSTWTYPLGK